jgi:cell wall-associated NlpC family hydrolase
MKPLDVLADELLGWPYDADFDCWALVRHLFVEGRGIVLDALPELNRLRVQEVWFRGDARPLMDVVEPWDILVLTLGGPLADHTGIVMDARYFLHSRVAIGVCKEPLAKWQRRCLQVVRVQEQTSPPSGTC